MLVHPIYCLPQPEELYAHYLDVDKSVSIPIMIYNNPFTTGVDMKPELFARIVENTKNVRYVKESSGDEARVGQILELLGDTVTVFGTTAGSAQLPDALRGDLGGLLLDEPDAPPTYAPASWRRDRASYPSLAGSRRNSQAMGRTMVLL